MTQTLRVAAAQTLEYREDIQGALGTLHRYSVEAEAAGACLLCLPEGFLQGYLIDEAAARRVAFDLASPAFAAVAARLPPAGPILVFGLIETEAGRLYNTAVVMQHGRLTGRYRKRQLLEAERAFDAGEDTPIFHAGPLKFGINICYDTNFPAEARRVADGGASLIVCPTNNMLRRERAEAYRDVHNAVRGERCRETGLWLISADVTGEREGRIALGPTAVLDPSGRVAAQLPLCQPGLLVFDLPLQAA